MARDAAHHALRRLAELGVPDARPQAVLRRDVLPAAGRARAPRLPAHPAEPAPGVAVPARRACCSRPRWWRRRCSEHLAAPRAQGAALPGAELAAGAQAALAARFDPQWGGFGARAQVPLAGQPLLPARARGRRGRGARDAGRDARPRWPAAASTDQLAGGFHRYSTDAAWLVPHFEKMLYDNAALARLYAEAARLAPEAGFERVARVTLRLRAARADRCRRRLPLGDRRGDGRPRGRLLHVDRGRARRRARRSRADACSARRYGFEGEPTFEADRYVRLPARAATPSRRRAPGPPRTSC